MGVMELRVESSEGCSMPPGCYIGVRIGDVLKQGRYEPQRCYNFEQVDRRKNAKIDIYQHVGSCVLAVDPDVKSTHEVSITATDPAFTGLRLKVDAQSRGAAEPQKPPRTERVSAMKSQAKEYLIKHSIEEKLANAVKTLLKEQPADPMECLCRLLRSDLDTDRPPAAAALKSVAAPVASQASAGARPAAVSPFATYYKAHFARSSLTQAHQRFPEAHRPAPSEELGTKVELLRQEACQVLLNACEDGNLFQALTRVNHAQVRDKGRAAERVDPNALKERARRELVKASETGTLQKTLREIKVKLEQEVGRADLSELRKRAARVLVKACDEDTLRKAVLEVKLEQEVGKADLSELRKRAARVLAKACDEGTLRKAVLEVQQEQEVGRADLKELRARAARVLVKACEEGTLLEVKQGHEVGQADLSELRKRAASVLVKASEDGKLENTLTEIWHMTVGEEKGMQAMPFRSKPSVGSWLMQKRPKERAQKVDGPRPH